MPPKRGRMRGRGLKELLSTVGKLSKVDPAQVIKMAQTASKVAGITPSTVAEQAGVPKMFTGLLKQYGLGRKRRRRGRGPLQRAMAIRGRGAVVKI